MKARLPLLATAFTLALALLVAPAATAQPKVEIGGSLASAMVGLDDDDDTTVFGVPSAGFGLLNPGVYASFFLGTHVAVEPQVGLIWASSGGHSSHLLAAAAQLDYFLKGTAKTSPYLFASAGLTDMSGSSEEPKLLSAGGGLRLPAGDRLVFRLDGRYIHYTDEGGNALAFTFSIGGLLR